MLPAETRRASARTQGAVKAVPMLLGNQGRPAKLADKNKGAGKRTHFQKPAGYIFLFLLF